MNLLNLILQTIENDMDRDFKFYKHVTLDKKLSQMDIAIIELTMEFEKKLIENEIEMMPYWEKLKTKKINSDGWTIGVHADKRFRQNG